MFIHKYAIVKPGLITLVLLLNPPALSQTWDELVYAGKAARLNGNFEQAASLLAQAAEQKSTHNAEWYLYASILKARLKQVDTTFDLLNKAARAGMWDIARLERNKWLKPFQDDPRWQALLNTITESEAKKAQDNALTQPLLRDELKHLWKKDQDLVGKWDQQRIAINQNTQRLKDIISQHGFPTTDMVGTNGSWIAWAIAQHAFDLAFQQDCLILMEVAMEQGKLQPALYAELQDRIMRNTNQPQIYGMATVSKDGKTTFYPILDAPNVDARRDLIGLPPLKVYANTQGIDYEDWEQGRENP